MGANVKIAEGVEAKLEGGKLKVEYDLGNRFMLKACAKHEMGSLN